VLEQDQAAPSAEAETPASRPRPAFTAPKGVPTPKRSEAQPNRRQPYQAPASRKAATRQTRERDRADRVRQTDAYQRGEEWALPRKDKGPVRALARDVVDARRSIAEYYVILAVVTVALLFLFPASLKGVADALVFVVLAVVVGEGWLVGQKIKRLARERHPGHSTQGVTYYAVMRGISMRRLRMPKPRVNRGDKL
jgi:hypothetical protein